MANPLSRSSWIDAAKGFAIILVVFGHCWRGTNLAGLLDSLPTGLFAGVDQRIYAFHMPFFFLISGFFLIRLIEKNTLGSFLKSRIVRLLYPLVLWTYIFAFSKVAAGQLSNVPVDLSDLLTSPIPGLWQFWFLWALFVLHMVLAVLRPAIIGSSAIQKPALWGLLAISLALLTQPLPHELMYWTSGAPKFAPYLIAGAIMGVYGLLKPQNKQIALVSGGVFVLLVMAVPALRSWGLPDVVIAFSLCLSLWPALAWFGQTETSVARLLIWLGRYSMIIFLSHTLFSAAVRIGLVQLGITQPALHVVCGTLAGLLLPIALVKGSEIVRVRAYLGT